MLKYFLFSIFFLFFSEFFIFSSGQECDSFFKTFPIVGCSSLQSVAASGLIFISCTNNVYVSSLSSRGDSLTYRILVDGSNCRGIISTTVNSVAGIIYVVCQIDSKIISVPIPSADFVSSTDPLPASTTVAIIPIPIHVSFDPLSGTVFISADNGIYSVSGSTTLFLASNADCEEPNDVIFDSSRGLLFAACKKDGRSRVLAIDPIRYTINEIVNKDQCNGPRGMTLNTVTGVLYIACWNGRQVISVQNSIITQLLTVDGPLSISVNSRTGVVYVSTGLN